MRRIRLPLTMLVILLVASGLVVWDGYVNPSPEDNAIPRLSASEALLRSVVAARASSSVHVRGSLPYGDVLRPLDMTFKGTQGATGSVAVGRAELTMTRIGTDLYVIPKAGSFAELGEAGKLLEGFALKFNAATAPEDLGSFTRWDLFLGDLFARVGQVRKGDRARINGVNAIALVGAGGGAGTLWVATTGDPFPVRLESPAIADRPAAILDFVSWNQDVELTVPQNVYDTTVGPAGGQTPPAPTTPAPATTPAAPAG